MKNMLVIKQNLIPASPGEPLPYNTGFGLTERLYELLLKASKDMRTTMSEVIRMALNYVFFDEKQIKQLREKKEENDKLACWRTVNLNELQAKKITELSTKYGISKSKIINMSIGIFLKQIYNRDAL